MDKSIYVLQIFRGRVCASQNRFGIDLGRQILEGQILAGKSGGLLFSQQKSCLRSTFSFCRWLQKRSFAMGQRLVVASLDKSI